MADPAATDPAPITPVIKEPRSAKVLISVLTLIFGAAALGCAFLLWFMDHTQSIALVGAINLVLGVATQVPNYWLGSSAGSDKKTDYLAASPAVVGPLVPGQTNPQ